MKRGHVNNLEFFLSHVGKIHMNGLVFMLFIPKLFFFLDVTFQMLND